MYSRKRLGRFFATFFAGICFGFGFAYVLLNTESVSMTPSSLASILTQSLHSHDDHTELVLKEVSQHEDKHSGAYVDMKARILGKKVRVLCWVLTMPDNHKKKAIHVKRTWGKRCDMLLFMSSENDPELPSVGLKNVKEGRKYLWGKTREAFKYIYDNHLEDADWFLKADDDTYVIVENLRFMLKDYDPNHPIYFGCKFILGGHKNVAYMSGGAGYVLSKDAVKKFVNIALSNNSLCNDSLIGREDVEMGRCMKNAGVEVGDSRDTYGRYRFLPFEPERHIIPGHVNLGEKHWYWKYINYTQKQGMDCCSDTAVTMHYVTPQQMYVLEYLLYHLRPFGISTNIQKSHPQRL